MYLLLVVSPNDVNKSVKMATMLDTNRIWDNPFPGMVRLQGSSDLANEGYVEVYCNGQWGTICSTSSSIGRVICRQLGYGAAVSSTIRPL